MSMRAKCDLKKEEKYFKIFLQRFFFQKILIYTTVNQIMRGIIMKK